jgi:hypothetical protein
MHRMAIGWFHSHVNIFGSCLHQEVMFQFAAIFIDLI